MVALQMLENVILALKYVQPKIFALKKCSIKYYYNFFHSPEKINLTSTSMLK